MKFPLLNEHSVRSVKATLAISMFAALGRKVSSQLFLLLLFAGIEVLFVLGSRSDSSTCMHCITRTNRARTNCYPIMEMFTSG